MALVIEDGTIVAGATSFVANAEADTLLAAMGNAAWAALDEAQQDARLAQGFLLVNDPSTYDYTGETMDALQEALWPRTGATRYRGPAVPEGTIPPEVKRAQIVAAGGLADGSIVWGASATARAVKSESVEGVGSRSYTEPGKSAAQAGRLSGYAVGWPAVTAILAPLLDRSTYGTRIVGVGGFTEPSYGGLFDVGMHDGVGGEPGLTRRRAPGTVS